MSADEVDEPDEDPDSAGTPEEEQAWRWKKSKHANMDMTEVKEAMEAKARPIACGCQKEQISASRGGNSKIEECMRKG
jgi:hypothetical protein